MPTNPVIFDILLKNGLLIDPSQGIRALTEVGIAKGQIAAISNHLKDSQARRVYDLTGKIITPGWIDLHCHPVGSFAKLGLNAQSIGVDSGVTLLCDAGSAGAGNFSALRDFLFDLTEPDQNLPDKVQRGCSAPKTDVVCFLNVAVSGQIQLPEIRKARDIDINACREVIATNKDIIRGIKIRAVQAMAESVGIAAVISAKRLAKDLQLPLMLHIGETRQRHPADSMDAFSRKAVALLDKGDILSHYLTWEPGGMIRPDGRIETELEAAHNRGIILDVAHGLNHFSSKIASHALARGMLPSVISTDLCKLVAPVVPSLAVVMSKFINLGLTLDQVIAMVTLNPARALGLAHCRGSLKPGMPADITILEQIRGKYFFSDGTSGEGTKGDLFLEPRMIFKAGKVWTASSGYDLTEGQPAT
jgi:dihydroorotase